MLFMSPCEEPEERKFFSDKLFLKCWAEKFWPQPKLPSRHIIHKLMRSPKCFKFSNPVGPTKTHNLKLINNFGLSIKRTWKKRSFWNLLRNLVRITKNDCAQNVMNDPVRQCRIFDWIDFAAIGFRWHFRFSPYHALTHWICYLFLEEPTKRNKSENKWNVVRRSNRELASAFGRKTWEVN